MSERPRETELKLDVAPEEVAALRSGLRTRFAQDGDTAQLVSVYYDTSDAALREAGVSLRVRSSGDAIVQTVKQARGRGAGLFDRAEWEKELSVRQPDLEAFAATPAGASFELADLRLAPVFEVKVERTRWTVNTGQSSIEVALDTGRLRAGRRTEVVAELELELKRGRPRDLFRLLADIEDVASLRPGVQAKSERGYRLAGGKPDKPVKAAPVELMRDMTAAEAFRSIVGACIRHFGLNDPIIVRKRTSEALHQARVALRRLRSALSLFGDMIADGTLPQLKTALRTVSRELGDARNLDVYLERSAGPEAEASAGEPGLKAFLREIEARRDAAYDRVVARLQSPEFRHLILRLVAWLEAGPWLTDDDPLRAAARQQPVRVAAAGILRRRRRKVKRKGRHLAALDPASRHRVRIDAKKLRYAAEFFAALPGGDKRRKRQAAFVAALEELQEHLGQLNDIQTGDDIAVSFATGDRHVSAHGSQGLFAAAHSSGRRDVEVGHLLESAEAAHKTLCKAKAFWSGWDA